MDCVDTTNRDAVVWPLGSAVTADACVLVVDDSPANVALLKRVLQSGGIDNVIGVTDPRQAVATFLQLGADAVLLDLTMPHMDGFAVMAALRDVIPAEQFVPVLVLTADTSAEVRDRALRAGAKDFVTKPFDRTEVVLRVHSLLETRALYATVQRHNDALKTELDQRAAHEQRVADARRQQRSRIDTALAEGVLSMVFQPIADLRSGAVVGVEALARFACEPRRPPNEWFDDAAGVGRGTELELAAVAAALRQLDHLPPGIFMAVNVSPLAVVAPALGRLLDGVAADRVVLEVTEHDRIEDYPALLTALDALRRQGIRVAVDDAGSGYAGLRHVLSVRPDILKLDIDLTRGIDADPARRALGTALVTFAGEIAAIIVAEGVETPEELGALRRLGITHGQGYHLARPGALPLTADRLEAVTAATSSL